MNYKIFTLFIVVVFIANVVNAKILRVGYTDRFGVSATVGVDYALGDIATAVTDANPFDTIQVYGSIWGVVIEKPLIIIGFGYNLDAHPGLQVINEESPSYVEGIVFGPGSDGSVVIGMTSNGPNAGFQCGDYNNTGTPVSNITFKRCSGFFNLLNMGGGLSNIKIIDCVCKGIKMYYGSAVPVTNLQIYNCIFGNGEVNLYNPNTTASIVNCVSTVGIGSYLRFRDASVLLKNCIIYNHDYYGENSNTSYENNFFGEAPPNPLPPGSNNRWSQDWALIFNRLGGTDDSPGAFYNNAFDENYYILKAGSPAINAGENSANQPTDCGIFGGDANHIYRPSGIPDVPAFYQLTSPSVTAGSSPYKITISVRSNN